MNRMWTSTCTILDQLRKYPGTDVGSEARKFATLLSGNFKVSGESLDLVLSSIIDVLEGTESILREFEEHLRSDGTAVYRNLVKVPVVGVEYSSESRWFYLTAHFLLGEEAADVRTEILDYFLGYDEYLNFETRLKITERLISLFRKMWNKNQTLSAASPALAC